MNKCDHCGEQFGCEHCGYIDRAITIWPKEIHETCPCMCHFWRSKRGREVTEQRKRERRRRKKKI